MSLNDKANLAQRKIFDYNSYLENSLFFDCELDAEDDSFFRTNLTNACENDPQSTLKLQLSKHNSQPVHTLERKRSSLKENALERKILQFRKSCLNLKSQESSSSIGSSGHFSSNPLT